MRQKPGNVTVGRDVGGLESGAAVLLPRQGEHGIRATRDALVHVSGEVDPQEGEARVGNWVDGGPDALSRLGSEVVVSCPGTG